MECRGPLKDNFKEHQITTSVRTLWPRFVLKDNFKEHQITTILATRTFMRNWKTISKSIKSQPRSVRTDPGWNWKTISKSIKSQLIWDCMGAFVTERQFQRASNHNHQPTIQVLSQLKDNFKEHQITTICWRAWSQRHWKTISKSIKSQLSWDT